MAAARAEACIAAEVNGPASLWARATASSATIPLGALAALIPDEVRSDDPLELVRRTVAALRATVQLVLSVRTVETYIYRAMQKRGVTNRRDL